MDINIIKEFVRNKLEKEPTGHDYLHALRVYKNSMLLIDEYVDKNVIMVSALIHDLIDHKLDEEFKTSKEDVMLLLKEAELTDEQVEHIIEIIENISFSKGNIPESKEGKIVQDADRLDALGAIGIARTFSYGGKHKRLIYDPQTKDGDDSVSHFYQKLFLLKDKMNTTLGRKEAIKRTEYMEEFISTFYNEVL